MRPRWRGGADSARSGNSCERTSERERERRAAVEGRERRKIGGWWDRAREDEGWRCCEVVWRESAWRGRRQEEGRRRRGRRSEGKRSRPAGRQVERRHKFISKEMWDDGPE